jgi:rubrerythrin
VAEARVTLLERALRPIHRWIWRDARRCARKLLTFAATEADGSRDLSRAAELTADARLRRLLLRHALDERRHAALLRERGVGILDRLGGAPPRFEANWIAPGERGLDDLHVEAGRDAPLLAFLHVSEAAATRRFEAYREVVADDETRALFGRLLEDELFHMRYTRSQLRRLSPRRHGLHLWTARASRLWKGYLRLATALAGLLGSLVLLVQYFVLLPPFALLAKRAARREAPGWSPPVRREGRAALERQY